MEGQIEEFLQYLSVEKGLSTNTLAAYGNDLKWFREFQARQGRRRAQEVTRRDLLEFLADRKRGGLSSRSIAREITTLRN
ncbi:MAG TPA: site-specific integrase, partial [Nitrospiria bacterium]